MTNPPNKNEKTAYSAIGADTWMQGAKLGMVVMGIFVLTALLIFGISMLISSNLGLSIAVGIVFGPILGGGGFLFWWLRQVDSKSQ